MKREKNSQGTHRFTSPLRMGLKRKGLSTQFVLVSRDFADGSETC